MKKNYVQQVLIALDQFINALIGGWADETISSRAYRQNHKPFWKVAEKVIDAIFFWQHYHCQQSYFAERTRSQQPPELRE